MALGTRDAVTPRTPSGVYTGNPLRFSLPRLTQPRVPRLFLNGQQLIRKL